MSAGGCGSVRVTPDATGALPDDAPADMMIDMPAPVTRFDVGYVNDINIVPLDTTSIHTLVLVVNTGTAPLHLENASVLTFSDDSDGIDWEFRKRNSSTFVLDSGRAAGALSPSTRAVLVDAGYVTERIDDNVLDFEMNFLGTPATGVVDNAQAVLRIDGVEAVLRFKITTVSTGTSPTYNSGRRVSSQ